MGLKRKQAKAEARASGDSTGLAPCKLCEELIPHKDLAMHLAQCTGPVDKTVEWVWELGAGARLRTQDGANEEAASNLEGSMNMLAGDEHLSLRSRVQAGLPEIVVTLSAGGDAEGEGDGKAYSFDLILRYGRGWPADAAVGAQRTTTRVKPSTWKQICRLTKAAAAAAREECINNEDDDLMMFCYNLVIRVQEDFQALRNSEEKNLHDHMMSKAQDGAEAIDSPEARALTPPSLTPPAAEAPDPGAGMLQHLRNLRTTRAPALEDIHRIQSNESGSASTAHASNPFAAAPCTPDAKNSPTGALQREESERSGSPARSMSAGAAETSDDSSSSDDVDSDEDSSSSSTADSSGSDDSSSSSGGRFDWGRVQEKQKQEDEDLNGLSVPSRETTRTYAVSTASIITPPERRRYLVLRHLLLKADEEDHMKQAIIDSLCSQGVLRCFPKDREDQDVEECVDRLLTDGAAAEADGRYDPSPPSGAREQNTTSWFAKNFKPEKQLGRGGQGRVFLVQNNIDRLYYAVKRVLLPMAEEGEKDRARVEAEIQTLARLRHPSIVRYFVAWFEEEPRDGTPWPALAGLGGSSSMLDSSVAYTMSTDPTQTTNSNTYSGVPSPTPKYDPDATQTVVYIQMEYCYQETLRHALNLRIIKPAEQGEAEEGIFLSETDSGLKILFQLLECVEYIHQQGVIHRDLKPENIFFDLVNQPTAGRYFAGHIKVGDFGLATATNEQRRPAPVSPRDQDLLISAGETAPSGHPDGLEYSMGIGTPLYAAPEQEMRRDYDHKVDEYSVGIIAYEMFSGFSSAMERHRGISELRRTGKVPLEWVGRSVRSPRSVNLNLAGVVEKLVARDPAERATAGEVLPLLPKPQAHEDMLEAVDLLVDDHNRSEMTRMLRDRVTRNVNHLNSLDWQHYLDSLRPSQLSRASRTRAPPIHVRSHGLDAVKECILNAARLAGCIELDVEDMIPSNSFVKHIPAYHVTDINGNLLMVPMNPCVAFSRWLSLPHATPLPTALRRFGVSRLPEGPAKGGAATSETAWGEVVSLDVVNAIDRPDPLINRVVDAEVLTLLAGSLQGLPALSETQMWLVRINHVHLLSAFASLIEERSDERAAHPHHAPIDRLLAVHERFASNNENFATELNLHTKLAGKLMRLLQQRYYVAGTGQACGEDKMQTCEDFVTLASSVFGIKHALSGHGRHDKRSHDRDGSALSPEQRDLAVDGLRELQRLAAVLVDMDFRQRYPHVTLVLDPVLRDESGMYDGLLWTAEVALKDRRQQGKAKGLRVGMGGRYSRLLDSLRRHYESAARLDVDCWGLARKAEMHHIPEGLVVCASGGYLAVNRLADALWRNHRPPPGAIGSTLYVHMKSNADYSAKLLLQIATRMRALGISTEYQLDPQLDEAALRESCKAVHIQWMLRVHADSMVDFEKGREPSLHFKLTKVTLGGLLKQAGQPSQKEVFEFDAEVATVAKRVAPYVGGGACASAPPPSQAPAGAAASARSVKLFGTDGKGLDGATSEAVVEAVSRAFKDTPPSRCCIVTALPAAEVREVVTHMYQTHAGGSGDAWTRTRKQLAEVIREKAASYTPMLLIYSVIDERFEVAICSSIASRHSKADHGAAVWFARSDRVGKAKSARKEKKHARY